MAGSTEGKAINPTHFFFSLRVKEDSAFHRGSSVLSVASVQWTLEDACQMGKSKCTAFPKLAISRSPCNPVAASSPKDLLSSSTSTWSHQCPYHLVPTATLHKQINTPGHSSRGSVRNRNRFLTRIIGLSSLQICKRNAIWYNTL